MKDNDKNEDIESSASKHSAEQKVRRLIEKQWRDCADCKHVQNFTNRAECITCNDDPSRPYWEFANNR
jgi:hypothetical protein